MPKHSIYIVTSPSNKQYVGQTVLTPEKRWDYHYHEAKYNYERAICRAIRKYGKDNFVIRLLIEDISNQEEANLWEILMIRNFNTFQNGYNLTEGGSGTTGREVTEDVRKKISMTQKGKFVSEETRRRISKAGMGRIVSKETGRKISKANMGRVGPMLGKSPSESTRQKISKKLKGRVFSKELRRKLSQAAKGKFVSDETRQKQSEVHKGILLSDEHKRNISIAIKLHWEKRRRKNK